MTYFELAQIRYHNQRLAQAATISPTNLLKYFVAIQAQEYAQSKWALSLRLTNIHDHAVEKELNAGRILRTHLLRPTWHFVTAQDIRWLLQLTAPRVHAASAFMYRQEQLDTKLFQRCIKILIEILEGNKQLTRDAIAVELGKRKIIASGHRLSYIMEYAELESVVCSGARTGNQFTYALLDERVKPGKPFDRPGALSRLAFSYFTSRGPATVHDFSTWSGLTITDCRVGLEYISSKLDNTTIDNKIYYWLKGTQNGISGTDHIQLLPIYDEFIMGYKDRSAIFTQYNLLKNKPGLQYDGMIVENGQVIGTWRRKPQVKTTELFAEFFKPLNKKQKNAFQVVIEKHEAFDGRKIIIK